MLTSPEPAAPEAISGFVQVVVRATAPIDRPPG